MQISKKKTKGKKGSSPLHIEAFQDRVVVEGEIFNSVESTIVDLDGRATVSSLPHLTHKTDKRAAHITSSRVVCVSGNYTIHQRFHQNDDGESEPTHDRYFAVNTATGVVHGATARFNDGVHLGKNDTLPMREATLATTDKSTWTNGGDLKLVFTVGEVDNKVPPLSPRTVQRKLPPSGYKKI